MLSKTKLPKLGLLFTIRCGRRPNLCLSLRPAEELDISAPDQTNWPALMIPIFALNGSFYAFAKTQAEVGDFTVMQLLIHALEGGFNIEAHHLAPSDFLCIDLDTPADFQHIQELLKTNAVFMDEVN